MGGSVSSDSYDSTWEEDEEDISVVAERSTWGSEEAIYPKAKEIPRNLKEVKSRKFSYKYMFSEAAWDMHSYRHRFQPSDSNYQRSPDKMTNLEFYKNQMRFEPDGLYIDDLLSNWKYQYDILEENHNYIQWLFPLREVGRNSYATPLHEQEIEMMKNDEDVKRRLREAYKFMLQFYGLQLLDENSGIVGRAENWQKRYWNLDRHSHNNLRITRILKCLGDLGYEHYQGPLIKFFLEETLCYGNLQHVKKSVLDYFLFSVRDKNKRKTLVRFAWENYEPKDQFIWGPVEVLRNDQRIRSKRTLDGGSNNVVESNEEISCSRCCVCVSI